MNKIIEFDRFWCKSKSKINLDSTGFLPDSIYSWDKNPNIVDFDAINTIQCAILLGENGSGKSTTVQKEISKLCSNSIDDIIVFLDLNEFSDEKRLIEEVFDSKEIQECRLSNRNIVIFLDSFDECLLEIPKLANIFKRQLSKISEISKKLKLRIICRSGYWNNTLNSFLLDYFDGELSVFEIAPLKYKDVKYIVSENGINSEEFMNEVEVNDIQPFAMNIITLNMLMSYYNTNKALPKTKDEIYNEGCRFLCVEPNIDRQINFNRKKISPEKKLAIASRIAAIMIFCNKQKIDIRQTLLNDEITLSLKDIQEGTEITDTYTFLFTQDDIFETITETSLFSYYEEGIYTFYHRAFEEYLAAKYITKHQFNLQQILSLITVSNDDEKKTVEQLKGVASWITDLSFIDSSIDRDPLNLLSGDISKLSNGKKKKLVQSILYKLVAKTITDFDLNLRANYRKLKYDGLAKQIKPYILGKNHSLLVRRFAIDVSEQCELHELSKELLAVLNDESDDIQIREESINALSKIAPRAMLKKLKKYAIDKECNNDSIKGTALFATWPNITSTKEVFDSLIRPKDRSMSSYGMFINYRLSDSLSLDTIDCALNWFCNDSFDHFEDSLEGLKIKIIYYCWKNYSNLSSPQKKIFANALIKIIKNYDNINPCPRTFDNSVSPILISEAHRNDIVMYLIPLMSQNELQYLIHNNLIKTDIDFQFIVNAFKSASLEGEQRIKYAYIITYLNYSSVEKRSVLIELYNNNSDIQSLFQNQLESIELGSEKAKHLKELYTECQNRMHENKKASNIAETGIDIPHRIQINIDKYESTGEKRYFIQVFMEMTLTSKSRYYDSNKLFSDITALENWKELHEHNKEKIINLSEKFITENDDCYNDWFRKNLIGHTALAGYCCLKLLAKYRQKFIKYMNSKQWKKWIHTTVCCFENSNVSSENSNYQILAATAYSKIPNDVLTIIDEQIIFENNKGEHLFILNKIEYYSDAKMMDYLFTIVENQKLNDSCQLSLISLLLRKKHKETRKYALQYTLGNDDSLSSSIATILITYYGDDDMSELYDKLLNAHDFAEKVFLQYSNNYTTSYSSLFDLVSDKRLADIYLQLCNIFPKAEDSHYEGVHFLEPREEVARFRDSILNHLSYKGAIHIVEHIQSEIKDESLDYILIATKDSYRKNNWHSLLPDQFLRLVGNAKMRIVSNADDLLELIIESLDRLEERLQKENSLSFVLWNKRKNTDDSENSSTPKSEEELSDFIKDHLKSDIERYKISVYREVQLRRPNYRILGGRKGETTDIVVSLRSPYSNEEISVIIEVKGSWNTGVNQSIKDQLHDRYLETSTSTSHGLYLIGWYICDEGKSTVNKTGARTIDKAREKYVAKAQELSQSDRTIKSYILDCGLKN